MRRVRSITLSLILTPPARLAPTPRPHTAFAWPPGQHHHAMMMTEEEEDDLLAMDIDGLVAEAYKDREE